MLVLTKESFHAFTIYANIVDLWNLMKTLKKKARQGASIDRKKRLSQRMSLIRDSTTTKTGAIFLVSEFQGADDFSDRQATLIVDLDDIRLGINIPRLWRIPYAV